MSRLTVEINGKEIQVLDQYQAIWDSVESNEANAGTLLLTDPIAVSDGPVELVQSIAHFLSISGEMVGARLDDFKYVFGDSDSLDMEEWSDAVIVRIEV